MTEHTEVPSQYITHALRSPTSIEPHYYRAMLLKHFATMAGENAGAVLRGFYTAAEQQPRLQSTFYSAVQSAFRGLRPGSASVARRWDNVTAMLVTLAAKDATLATYISRDLLGRLTSLIGRQATGAEYQAASDILSATGKVPEYAEVVPQPLVHQVIKWHLHLAGNDFVRAAEKLTALRAVPVFVPELAKIENAKGVHVHAEQRDDDADTTLVLAFGKTANNIGFFDMPPHRNGHVFAPRPLSLEEVRSGEIGKQIRDRLERIAGDPMPHQDWVPPIAVEAYCNI